MLGQSRLGQGRQLGLRLFFRRQGRFFLHFLLRCECFRPGVRSHDLRVCVAARDTDSWPRQVRGMPSYRRSGMSIPRGETACPQTLF